MTRRIVLAAAAFALLLPFARAAAQETPGGKTAVRIAVADLRKIYEGYEKQKDEEKVVKAYQQRIRRRVESMRGDFRRLTDEMKNLSLGSPERLERKGKLEKIKEELRNLTQTATRELNERVVRATRELYGEVREVVAEYAGEHGIDLVIKKQSLRADEKAMAANVSFQIGFQPVLYVDKQLEITDVIIERLNARYRAAKKEKKEEGAAGKPEKPGAAKKEEEVAGKPEKPGAPAKPEGK